MFARWQTVADRWPTSAVQIGGFRDRTPDVLVRRMFPGMNQRRPLIVDQELVEGNAVVRRKGRDAIDAAGDVVDSCLQFHVRQPFC